MFAQTSILANIFSSRFFWNYRGSTVLTIRISDQLRGQLDGPGSESFIFIGLKQAGSVIEAGLCSCVRAFDRRTVTSKIERIVRIVKRQRVSRVEYRRRIAETWETWNCIARYFHALRNALGINGAIDITLKRRSGIVLVEPRLRSKEYRKITMRLVVDVRNIVVDNLIISKCNKINFIDHTLFLRW